jgi:hypothetical protein
LNSRKEGERYCCSGFGSPIFKIRKMTKFLSYGLDVHDIRLSAKMRQKEVRVKEI